MARIKLTFPEPTIYETSISVRIDDINYGGHLGNDSALSIIHEARVRFLTENGLSEKDFFGTGIIMTDVVISYLAEMFHGDSLNVEIGVGEVGRMYFELCYRFTVDGNNTLLAKSGFVCFDYNERKVQPIPEEFERLVQRLQNQ